MVVPNNVIKTVLGLDKQDLDKVTEAVKLRYKQLSEILTLEFNKGDKVAFKGRYGEQLTGSVIGVNRKTVNVRDSKGTEWRISPSLLKKI